MTILIQNGQVINPATGMNEVADVLVENGVVSKIEKGIKAVSYTHLTLPTICSV